MNEQLSLRAFQLEDVDALVLHANNPAVSKTLREEFPYPYTSADALWWLEQGCCLPDTENYAITVAGECVGCIGLTYKKNEHAHSVELGYWLGEAVWGKGIASWAVNEMISIVFKKPRIRRIIASAISPNVGSIRVLEKNGFELEGVFKEGMYLRGVYYDECVYTLRKGAL